MAELSGINLAMQTPFQEDGSVDYSRWEELIDAYIDAGIHGLVLGSGTGQHPYLTEDECDKLFELGTKRIDGRCTVICQTSALNMDEVVRRSKNAQDAGADALMILPPYMEGPTDNDGLFEFYREIDANISVDIVGYNIPQATGLTVSPELFTMLAELPNYNYIKDSSGDLTALQSFVQTGSAKVLNGADGIAFQAFMSGAVGAIWGSANYMPHECVELYDLTSAGKYSEAQALWVKMLPSLLWLWNNDYIPAMKSAVRLRGFGGGGVRKPLRPIDADAEAALAKTLEALN